MKILNDHRSFCWEGEKEKQSLVIIFSSVSLSLCVCVCMKILNYILHLFYKCRTIKILCFICVDCGKLFLSRN